MGYAMHEIADSLKAAASETLENLAFTELTSRPVDRIEGPQSKFKGARISLGTMGNLDMVIGLDLLAEIALVLFNPPGGDVEPEMLDDTLNEILNIVAGRFLYGIFQGKSDFALGLPEFHLDMEEWNSLPLRSVMVTDGGLELAVGLQLTVTG